MGLKMEVILQQIAKDIITPKFARIKQTAQEALGVLQDQTKLDAMEAWEIRQACLLPLKLALESKAKKLGHSALAGIQIMFHDERFRSSMETSEEDKWLPSQVLSVLSVAPTLAEDLQVEVIKLLLNMTVTATWCTGAATIIKICQVYVGSYQNCSGVVQGAVQAAMITMISRFVSGLVDFEQADPTADDGDDVLADFKCDNRCGSSANLIHEVTLILAFLTDRLEKAYSSPQGRTTLPLLLEGVGRILVKVPAAIKHNAGFQELLWKRLCPVLISLLGEPKPDKASSAVSKLARQEVAGKTSGGGSTSASNITQSSAKIIYNIAGDLASLVGEIPALRPVLEALFHKMLVFPLPQHKHDSLLVVKELLTDPKKVISLLGSKHKHNKTNMALIKMLVDTVHQCSHASEQNLVFTSITCVDGLLASLERISNGEAVDATQAAQGKVVSRSHVRRSMTLNPDDDGGSELSAHVFDEEDDVIQDSADKDKDTAESLSSPPSSAIQGNDATTSTPSSVYQSPSRQRFEAQEKSSAGLFVQFLRHNLPALMDAGSVWEVDEAIQELAARFCSDLSHQQASSGSESTSVVLNADGIYVSTISIMKLNHKLIGSGYYSTAGTRQPPIPESEFVNALFGSGLLLFLPPVWLSEVYRLVVADSLLDPVTMTTMTGTGSGGGGGGQRGNGWALKALILDLEGAGTLEVRGRLMSEWWEESKVKDEDNLDEGGETTWKAELGKSLAANVMSSCWDEILDILSVMLNDTTPASGTAGVVTRHNLALLLATDSAREDVRRARGAICIGLNGLQRAAKLCCTLGLQHLCGSAFAQLARTSCSKEDFRAASVIPEGGKGQSVKGSLVGSTKPKLVKLHAAHVLSMDVVMTTGMEMGSHSPDCWKHVLRCCAHISELEHTYFSQGNNQTSLPKVMQGSKGQDTSQAVEADGDRDTDLYFGPVGSAIPVAPRINVPALIQQSKLESGWDNSLSGGGVLTFAQASKALCGLSQEVDSLFEDSGHKLCLEALLSFLKELGEAALTQVHKVVGGLPPANALHLYRLQQVLVTVVNSARPLLHLLKVWSVVSPYLVQATGHRDRSISKMAVTCIHEFIVSLVSQREEKVHFHVNEFVCKTFEDMLCLDLCDGDVQDQIVCCICELVEACNIQLHSGWRPVFGALRSVKIEYTTSEAVNEARQRHVAAVMDVFDVYLDMDNISVFANATVDCVLCLLKYVHGPSTFNSDGADALSDSDSDDGIPCDREKELESLCVPALKYLTRVCHILASMWRMPACPVFKGAHRIHVSSAGKLVDPEIPYMNFDLFAKEFALDKHKLNTEETEAVVGERTADKTNGSVRNEAIPETDESTTSAGSSSASRHNRCEEETMSSLNEKENHSAPSSLSPDSSFSSSHRLEESEKPKEMTSPANQKSVRDGNGNQSHNASGSSTEIHGGAPRPSELLLLSEEEEGGGGRGSSGGHLPTLEELDNPSGVLHVWFLLLDGLVSAVNACPKAFQSVAMTTLVDLLKAAAHTPGPEFSLYCVNHLLLPMLQAWLRRGATLYGFWNTAIVSFKQFSGLVADLAVDNIQQFAGDRNLEPLLQLMLKQTLDGFIECVGQPVETISRLGCSCLRHILVMAGPSMSEGLWQIGAVGIRRALRVSLYNLRLLMALFHPNSDNFYGDIGQVKVATRSDCTVVDELRLRQMAKQVLLLDSQVSAMPGVQYDTDQYKSFVFLLYPPGRQDSLNPEHISTRVPFRHVIIGLLANQLLIQTVGSLLVDKHLGQDAHQTEQHTGHQTPPSSSTTTTEGLPGLLRYMSTRNLYQLLASLDEVCQLAHDFDTRPGLKFLLQKVAGLEVAANLYKAAASTTVFYGHALLEVCAHLDGSSMAATKATLTPVSESSPSFSSSSSSKFPPPTTSTSSSIPTIGEIKQQASVCRAKPWASGRLFLPLLQSMFEEMCETYVEVLQDAEKGSLLDAMAEQPIFFLTAQHDNVEAMKPTTKPLTAQTQAQAHTTRKGKLRDRAASNASAGVGGSGGGGGGVASSKSCESLPSTFTSTESATAVDSSTRMESVVVGMGSLAMETPQVFVGASEFDSSSDLDLEEGMSSLDGDRTRHHDDLYDEEEEEEEEERQKSKRELREDMQSKVYTVATDQVIENLMTQYKRHKHQRSMPNFVRPPRFSKTKFKVQRKEVVDEVIDKQQKSSIMKDSEARIQAWSDTLTAVLQMALNLPDPSFCALLPVVFTLVSQLMLYAADFALRDQLTQCFLRLGRLYDFAPATAEVKDTTSTAKATKDKQMDKLKQ